MEIPSTLSIYFDLNPLCHKIISYFGYSVSFYSSNNLFVLFFFRLFLYNTPIEWVMLREYKTIDSAAWKSLQKHVFFFSSANHAAKNRFTSARSVWYTKKRSRMLFKTGFSGPFLQFYFLLVYDLKWVTLPTALRILSARRQQILMRRCTRRSASVLRSEAVCQELRCSFEVYQYFLYSTNQACLSVAALCSRRKGF